MEKNNPEYKVYPNPSTGKFFLSVSDPERVKQVDVFDLRGNKIKTYQNGFGFPLEVDLTGQAKGSYLIKVSEAEMAEELRIILK
ncbi:MAG: T9SS type A sorting domain-containing protein [Chloroflexia bacterium]|nr:T9SS type A sorting domain-containing protein [Chloroflexia bacterium]